MYIIELYAELINYLLRKKKENWTTKEYLEPYRGSDKIFAVYPKEDIKPFIKMCLILPFKYIRIIKFKISK